MGLLAANEHEQAEYVARGGIAQLEPSRAGTARKAESAVFGALHLAAADAEARQGKTDNARERLHGPAGTAASVCGDGNVCWTVFGPTNVAMHSMSIELAAGRTAAALRLAEQIDPASSVSVERRLTFLLQKARCHQQQGDNAAVLAQLLAAEREAPEDLRYNATAREMVSDLVKRARRSFARDVYGIATRIGIFDT